MSLEKSVVIPAYNEEGRIGPVVEEAGEYAEEVLVIDDGSDDGTAREAGAAGAKVVPNEFNSGYIGAIKTGFKRASCEVVLTMDADGEHDPADVPSLVSPIESDEADLVLGAREEIARPSEKILCLLTRSRVDVRDCGTGFRALRKDLADRLRLRGHCTCGTFVLEAKALGARIAEVPINLRRVDKPRGVAWKHFYQTWYVLRELISL